MPFDRSVVPDQDPAEQRLVHHAPLLVRCLLVSGPALGHQIKGAAHGNGHGVHLGVGAFEQGLGSGQLAGDALLLGLHQVQWQGIGVVRLQQLLPFGLELLDPHALPCTFSPVRLVESSELGADEGFKLSTFGLGETLTRPEQRNALFDLLDAHRSLGAAGAVLLLAQAVEVWVDGAVFVLGVHDAKARAALLAEDRADQEVVMGAPLFT